ncbi:MAG: hypothetical protein RLZZ540_2075 [Bacteroidota bacterium]|jgi:restriction endonuclease S subunit
MKKYNNYKDSGIEWIGDLPEHWEVKKLKYLVKEPLKYGANESAEEEILEDPRYIRITDFGNDGKLKNDTFKSLSFEKAENFLLKEGDVLFARSGATVGKTFLFKDYSGIACFAGYLIKASCDLDKMKPEFLYEFTNSGGYENWKQSIFQQSTIQNIGADKYNQLKIGVPSISEQKLIINYLDHKTTQIDTLIAKKEQFISLLQEERTAVINQAVTKGLDPKVKLKDSGIEWLGEIPEHWEVKRLKHLVKTPLKYGANESAEDEILEDPRYIRITDFGNDGKLRKSTFKSLSFDKAENFLLEEGDILFARSGATVGKTFFFKDYQGVACFAGYLIKATCNPMIMKAEFLYEFTNSSGYENWKQSIFQQSTIQNIGADKYNQLKIGVPSLIEQQGIIVFISKKTNEINILISKAEQEIELLKEYKTALISEVVTGKIDVRDVVLN